MVPYEDIFPSMSESTPAIMSQDGEKQNIHNQLHQCKLPEHSQKLTLSKYSTSHFIFVCLVRLALATELNLNLAVTVCGPD